MRSICTGAIALHHIHMVHWTGAMQATNQLTHANIHILIQTKITLEYKICNSLSVWLFTLDLLSTLHFWLRFYICWTIYDRMCLLSIWNKGYENHPVWPKWRALILLNSIIAFIITAGDNSRSISTTNDKWFPLKNSSFRFDRKGKIGSELQFIQIRWS